jgi:hypothetical protein
MNFLGLTSFSILFDFGISYEGQGG